MKAAHLVRRLALLGATLVASLLVAPVAHGQAAAQARGEALAAPALQSFGRGLLWRVDVKGARPSYLFGTLHWDDERILKLPPAVRRAFDAAHTFAPELQPDEEALHSFRRAMVSREPRLPQLLGEEAFRRIEPLLREHGVPREARAHLKPWAALLTLIQPRERPGIILDSLLMMEAERQKKAIVPLETMDEQIAVFEGMADQDQLALLRDAADNYDAIQEAVRPLADAYLQRDLAAIWKLNVDVMAGDALAQPHVQVFLARILYERNERMAQRLVPLLRSGGAFAAFGALHLYGEQGVPAHLAKLGFRVRPVY
jgi:hypothetical protein